MAVVTQKHREVSEAMAEFFGTLPEIARAVWSFLDGFYGLAIFVVSMAAMVGLLLLAKAWRATHGWLAAIAGMTGAAIAFWWSFGIMPSAFVYFMDGQRDLLEGTVVPAGLPGMDNVYQVLRDSIVVGQQTLFVIVFAIAMARIQRRYPRTLAEGEEKAPATGGYK